MQVKVLLILFLCLSTTYAINGKCRALAMSGGGDKGAYEAAVFITWANLVAKEDIAYDVVGGISVGSINGSGISAFAPGEEKEAAEWIFQMWNEVVPNDVFSMWPGGILEGIFERGGLVNNTNLKEYLTERIGDKSPKKKMSIGVADMNTARYISKRYNASDTLPENWMLDVMASTAMPLAFPPETSRGMSLLDGGVIWSFDILDPISRCLEIVDDESDIILDMIMTGRARLRADDDVDTYGTINHFMRGFEIRHRHKKMKNLNNTMIAHPRVQYRYIVSPSESLGGGPLPLDFSKETLEKSMALGKKDGEAAIKLGPGGYWNLMLEHYEREVQGEDIDLDEMLQAKILEIDKEYKFEST